MLLKCRRSPSRPPREQYLDLLLPSVPLRGPSCGLLRPFQRHLLKRSHRSSLLLQLLLHSCKHVNPPSWPCWRSPKPLKVTGFQNPGSLPLQVPDWRSTRLVPSTLPPSPMALRPRQPSRPRISLSAALCRPPNQLYPRRCLHLLPAHKAPRPLLGS